MKWIGLIALVAGVAAAPTLTLPQSRGRERVGAAADNDPKAEQEVRKLLQEWVQAILKRDLAAIDRIEAEDFSFINPAGVVIDKKGDLEQIKNSTFEAFDLDDVKVKVYGDTAIMTSKGTIKGKTKDQDISGTYRFTDVFVKRQGRWQAVASQGTRIAKP